MALAQPFCALDPEFTTEGVATAGMLGPGQAAWLSLPDTVQGANGMGLGSVLAGDEGGPLLSLSPSLPRPPLDALPRLRPQPVTLHTCFLTPFWPRGGTGHKQAFKAQACGQTRHRKVKRSSEKAFCRWFIQNAEEADHSHSLNVSNS